MYQGNVQTFDELVERATAIRQASRDFELDSRALEYDTDGRGGLSLTVLDPTGIKTGPYQMTDHAVSQLCESTDPKIPRKFLRELLSAPKLSPLGKAVPNFLAANSPRRNKIRCIDPVAGMTHPSTCRAVLSPSYRMLDNTDVILHALAPTMEGRTDLEIMSGHIDFDRMFLKIRSDTLRDEIVPGGGDVVYAGVRIENGETGLSALTCTPFVYRLVCKNGLTADMFKLRQIHLGREDRSDAVVRELFTDKTLRAESAVVFMKFQNVIDAALQPEGFRKIVDSMRQANADTFAGDVAPVVDALGEVLGLTQAERQTVIGNAHAEPKTRWGIINAITAAAESADNYQRADDFESFGGRVLALDSDSWRRVAEAKPQYARTIRLN